MKKIFTDQILLKKAHTHKHKILMKFTNEINSEYIKELCSNTNNKILLYTINKKISENYKNEMVGVIVYKIITNDSYKTTFFISLMSIHKNMRGIGYGSLILEEFIAKYKRNKEIELILLSLKSSYNFYKKLGFKDKNIEYIQKNENIKDCIMMSKIYVKNI